MLILVQKLTKKNMETISSRKVKARKEHVCNFCNDKIESGKIYRIQFNKHDEVYTWKNHIHCEEIADKLKMFDYCNDYGLDEESFCETIREEYIRIMQHHQSELFESEMFNYPDFKYQLKFVCEFHNIKID